MIGQRIQTKYGTCLIKSSTEMEVIDSSDDTHPNGTIIETPPIEIIQEKIPVNPPKKPKAPAAVVLVKPVKSAAQELAEAEAELVARKAKLAAILG